MSNDADKLAADGFKHTVTSEFLASWRKLRNAKGDVSWLDFSAAFNPSLMPQLLVEELKPDGGHTVRFMGTRLIDLWGQDLTGSQTEDLPNAVFVERFLTAARKVVQTPCGFLMYMRFISHKNKEQVSESLTLPLKTAGKADRIVTCSSVLETEGYDFDMKGRINTPRHTRWVDLGAGVPKHQV